MYGESIILDSEGNIEAEKNFSVEKEEGVYRISNYIIRDFDGFYDVLLTDQDVDYLEDEIEEGEEYDIVSETVKLKELFEDGFRVEMDSTLIKAEYDDLEVIQQGETVLDSEDEVLNRRVYERARTRHR